MTPPMQITADEINCLIYSYLQDSGFQHSAFSLRTEAQLDASPYSTLTIRRGELVELLAKSLLYSEVEAHWQSDEISSNCKAPFALLQDHVCSPDEATLSIIPLPPIATNYTPRQALPHDTLDSPDDNFDPSQKRKATDKPSGSQTFPVEKKLRLEPNSALPSENGDMMDLNGQTPLDGVCVDSLQLHDQKEDLVATLLTGHATEVFVCSWNPIHQNILATGAKDGVIHLWKFKPWDSQELETLKSQKSQLAQEDILLEQPIALRHAIPEEHADVTSVEWNQSGTLLASGSFDGMARVWTLGGSIFMSKQQHAGPIFSVKFSPTGKWLLTAGLDGTVCVWDMNLRVLSKQVKSHPDPCLDVDWLDESTFATGSADQSIHIFDLSIPIPLVTLQGHENEVNQIKCNKPRTLLASCSDDTTARIWEVAKWKLDGPEHKAALIKGTSTFDNIQKAFHTLQGHTDCIGSISWCPSDDEANQLLATAAFDATCRLWDAMTGACLRVFSDNSRPVFTLNFSTDGTILATGGGDGLFQLYDIRKRKLLWRWHVDLDRPGVFEIEWQASQRIAVCLENRSVGFIDLSAMSPLPT